MRQHTRRRVNDLFEIKMKIPLFENEFLFFSLDGEEEEIPLADARAVEMACENVKWQADDTYFDATFQVWVNGELFFENATTDAHGTWRKLMNALDGPGKHSVCFLDSPVDLQVLHEKHYTFQYIHTDYVWGDNNYLISSSKKTVTSEPLPMDTVEPVIREGFKQFAEFMLENDIPISKAYKEELRERLTEV